MQELFRVSVGIPTKDRPEDLLRCLQSVAEQSLAPVEVLLVDDGNLSARERELCRSTVEPKSRFHYLKKDVPSAALSRNLIARKAEGDLILILDDDTVMEADYVEELAGCFTQDREGSIGAVGGCIVNRRKKSSTELLWKRIFLLESRAPGDITRTMFESRQFDSKGVCEVRWLPAGITMYPGHILRAFPMEDFFGGRNGLEEIEHAILVGRHYKYLLNPKAKIYHYKSPAARESAYETGFKHAYNRCLIFKKYGPTGLKRLLFGWSFFGYVGGLVFSCKFAMARGNIAGLFRFLYDGTKRTEKSGEPFSAGSRR